MGSTEGKDVTKVEEECIRRIAAVKAVPVDSVTLDTTLESLQVDSLDRVTLSFDLEEVYGVEIPESKLHTIQIVRDVAVAIQEAQAKRQAAVNGAEPA